MKIQFESTIDEAVDVNLRGIKLLRTARRSFWEGLICALVLFAGFFFFLPDTLLVKLIFAVMAGVLFIVLYLFSYKKILKSRIKKLLIEQFGTDKPVPCEYEFDDEGLVFRRLGTTIKFQWNKATEINENAREVEIIFGKSGISVLPNRIFKDEREKDEWLGFAKKKSGIAGTK